jgi:hypothetical protein
MADSTLAAIRTKIRRLVRAPSATQITDAQIDEYINTFMLYDLPAHLQLEDLRDQLTFFTEIGKDVYNTESLFTSVFNSEQWSDACIATEKPMYIAGYPVFITQAPEQFWNLFPFTSTTENTGIITDGINATYVGMLQRVPFLEGYSDNGYYNSVGAPLFIAGDLSCTELNPGVLVGTGLSGVLDPITGVFTITFASVPVIGIPITVRYVPVTYSRPQAVLFWRNTFILRPVPDSIYSVTVEVRKQPLQLLATTTSPQIKQWWQYIAYGASKKIFEDRMDPDSIEMIMPEFKQQEALVLRRSLLYQANERSATIYTEQTGIGAGGFSSFGGPF